MITIDLKNDRRSTRKRDARKAKLEFRVQGQLKKEQAEHAAFLAAKKKEDEQLVAEANACSAARSSKGKELGYPVDTVVKVAKKAPTKKVTTTAKKAAKKTAKPRVRAEKES